MPVFVIIKVGTLADGMSTPAYQVAMRQEVPGLTWYDTHGTPGPNDPTTLANAAIRMDELNKQVIQATKGLVDGVAKTAEAVLGGIRAIIEEAEWNADFRQELLDAIDRELPGEGGGQ